MEKQNLDWCIVRIGEDGNWWVTEISDSVHWDIDGLGIIDPKQIQHLIELSDPLSEYGLEPSIIENAFYTFIIDEKLENGHVKLKRIRESLLDSDIPLFVLPDILDEEKGPYADFLNHVTRLRVKLLNDTIDFQQKLTIDELEEDIRERQNADFMEGRATHFFSEVLSIMEYVPEGYTLDNDDEDEEDSDKEDEEIDEDFPEIDTDEDIETDETMKWDEDEDEDEDEEDFDDEDEDSSNRPDDI
jgi:hypothetical protein